MKILGRRLGWFFQLRAASDKRGATRVRGNLTSFDARHGLRVAKTQSWPRKLEQRAAIHRYS